MVEGGGLFDLGMLGELLLVWSFFVVLVKLGFGEILGGLFFVYVEFVVFM